MKTSDFFYDLPEELIAQTPLEKRDTSRLLCLDKANGNIEHTNFSALEDKLQEGDCLVLNNTRVLPARIFGARTDTGSVVEFLLLKQKDTDVWECLAGPGKKAKIGKIFKFSDNVTIYNSVKI
jgi:S-adenosylmethionine:tRNA ribosyltransferase-isomerase